MKPQYRRKRWYHIVVTRPFDGLDMSTTVRAYNHIHAVADALTDKSFRVHAAARVEVYLAKVCLRCKHPNCPHCGNWCDVLEGTGDFEGSFCCDGACVYGEDIALGVQRLARWLAGWREWWE